MNFIQSVRVGIAAASTLALAACAMSPQPSNEMPIMTNYKQQVVELLKSIETGDSKPIAYINPNEWATYCPTTLSIRSHNQVLLPPALRRTPTGNPAALRA